MKKSFLLMITVIASMSSFAQIAINTDGTASDASAMLDISSSTTGILIPRVTSAQRTAISSPANGLLVYDSETDSFWYNDSANSGWGEIAPSSGLSVDGLSDGNNDGSSVFIGSNAGLNDDGSLNQNTGIGNDALKTNSSGAYNAGYGYRSLRLNTSGYENSAYGTSSLMSNDIGQQNTAIGSSSLYYNTSGQTNTAVGANSLKANITGRSNCALGAYAIMSNTSGNYNTVFGYQADYYNDGGSNNIIIGYQAGKSTTTHSKSGNIFLGYQAGYNEVGSNKLYIENSNSATPLIGGDFATDEVYINGTIKITGGTPGADKVLTSDASGNSSWETPQWGASAITDLSDASTQYFSLFLGSNSGQLNTSFHNTGIGFGVLPVNTSGSGNTALGTNALYSNVDGMSNTAIGMGSLGDNSSGSSNTAFGANAAANNTTGTSNVAIGSSSNYFNETGSNNTILGHDAGRGSALHNKSGNIFLGYRAGYNETGSNKLYIENSNSSSPLIGGDFSTDEVYFNTLKLGIGTEDPRELLEVASPSNSYGRMIVSDGGGDSRNAILFVSPTSSNQTARIEAFNYGSGQGLTLNFNTIGDEECVFGGNVVPEGHITENLGANGQAWNNVYAHNYITQGSAAFANINASKQLLEFPPIEKQKGAFDEFTEKGLKELDPASLPNYLMDENAILIDEMTTFNYKANYEQQLQIEELKAENAELKTRLDRIEQLIKK